MSSFTHLLSFSLLFASIAHAAKHHLVAGSVDPTIQYLWTLEYDDSVGTLTQLSRSRATGAHPTLALEYSNKYLQAAIPQTGQISRYSIGSDYSLQQQGTIQLPHNCDSNTDTLGIDLITSQQDPYYIYGAETTGTCSIVFYNNENGNQDTLSNTGPTNAHVQGLAFNNNSRLLYGIDASSNAIVTYGVSTSGHINGLQDQAFLANASSPRQLVASPTGKQLYIILQDTNQLAIVPLNPTTGFPLRQGDGSPENPVSITQYSLLTEGAQNTNYYTTSLTLSANSSYLVTSTPSRSNSTANTISAFTLSPTNGTILNKLFSRETGSTGGNPNPVPNPDSDAPTPLPATDNVAAAPFPDALVAVSDYPAGAVEIWRVDADGQGAVARWEGQDGGCCGEVVWLD